MSCFCSKQQDAKKNGNKPGGCAYDDSVLSPTPLVQKHHNSNLIFPTSASPAIRLRLSLSPLSLHQKLICRTGDGRASLILNYLYSLHCIILFSLNPYFILTNSSLLNLGLSNQKKKPNYFEIRTKLL